MTLVLVLITSSNAVFESKKRKLMQLKAMPYFASSVTNIFEKNNLTDWNAD